MQILYFCFLLLLNANCVWHDEIGAQNKVDTGNIIFKISIILIGFEQKTTGTELAHGQDERLLLFATLSGNLVAMEQQTGRIRWKIKDSKI